MDATDYVVSNGVRICLPCDDEDHQTCYGGACCCSCAAEEPVSGWYLIDADTDKRVRGPFEHSEAAGAARRELERRTPWSHHGNLCIIAIGSPEHP